MKNILITGISGFLGRNSAEKFIQEGYSVFGIDVAESNIISSSGFVKSDINIDVLKKFNKNFDVIIHCAGGSTVGASMQDPLAEYNKTVNTTLQVLDYIRLYNTKAKLIYPSSAAVYGNTYNRAINEADKLSPYSPYGTNKHIVEGLCNSYYNNFDVKSNIIRFFSIYGDGLSKQLLFEASQKFKKDNNPEFYGTGEEVRDWLHITDAVELIYKCSVAEDQYNVVNGGSGIGTKIKDVLSLLSRQYNNKSFSFNNMQREGDPQCYIADTTKAKQLNWSPTVKLEQGIKNYVKWFKN